MFDEAGVHIRVPSKEIRLKLSIEDKVDAFFMCLLVLLIFRNCNGLVSGFAVVQTLQKALKSKYIDFETDVTIVPFNADGWGSLNINAGPLQLPSEFFQIGQVWHSIKSSANLINVILHRQSFSNSLQLTQLGLYIFFLK